MKLLETLKPHRSCCCSQLKYDENFSQCVTVVHEILKTYNIK